MTWDEGLYVLVGSVGLKNILRRNFASDAWNLEFHPPIMMYVYGITYGIYVMVVSTLRGGFTRLRIGTLYEEGVRLFSGRGALFVVRFPSAVLGSLSVVLCYFTTLQLFRSESVAILAALILAFTPAFLAWSSLAMLESGLVFFYLASLYSLILSVGQNSLILAAASGVLLGLALGTKETGFGIILAALPWGIVRFAKDLLMSDSSGVWSLVGIFSTWIIVALSTLYIAWPWLWGNPFRGFKTHIQTASEMPSIPWAGWSFYIVRLAESTPVHLFFLYSLGTVSAFFLAGRLVDIIVILSWAILPLSIMSLPFIPKRVGAYEVTFLLPALSILAASAAWFIDQLAVALLPIPVAISSVPIVGASVLVILVLQCVTVHPYYMNYRNLFAHSQTGGNRGFPVGWWGEGLDLAMRYIDVVAPQNSTVWIYGPRSTAFYHSTRADSKRSLANEPLFDMRAKAGFDVPTDTHFYDWKTGDLKFYFPYYYPGRQSIRDLERLELARVHFVVVTRWATHDAALLDPDNEEIVSELVRNHRPVHTVKVKNDEVCWVFSVDNISVHRVPSVASA
jgi:4-amino-4-deoxy-L-arabinose transferase-like glycosyltransferase